MHAALVQALNASFADLTPSARLAAIAAQFNAPVFTTSLGKEDQLLTALIAAQGARIALKTLQTGRLFPETLALIETTQQRFNLTIDQIAPAPQDVDHYVETYGLDGFYDSVEARKACCAVRKLNPLAHALAGADAWVTGLRRSQSSNRDETPFAQFDAAHGLIKLNPLADVTQAQLDSMLAQHNVPISALHARGYPSIGCEPCTRAIKPGEHERAGRWWWEQGSSQECGLHQTKGEPTKTPAKKDMIGA